MTSGRGAEEREVEFRSMDGLRLSGTRRRPGSAERVFVVLVHGIAVDREEHGYYAEFARRLDAIDAGSLRFDLRGHGVSECVFEEVTLCGVMNDVGAACRAARSLRDDDVPIMVIAASFGGGLAGRWLAAHPGDAAGLVLLNPLLDYASRMLYEKRLWNGSSLTEEAAETLRDRGWLPHRSFRMGRALLNELPHVRVREDVSGLSLPVLTVHGDRDSKVPYDVALRVSNAVEDGEFVTVRGADHGFTEPGDDEEAHPSTARYREYVYDVVLDWIDTLVD